MSDMKAIETIYNGYKFRSRLEARWAVFFEALGVRYEYEKEGFELRNGRYLPDFWLPDHQVWVEIKGGEPTEQEIKLAYDLCHHSNYHVVIFFGMPATDNKGQCHAHDSSDSSAGCSDWDDVSWAICEGCNQPQLTLGKDKEVRVIMNADYSSWEGQCSCPNLWNREHTRIISSVNAAKQARFEHGEKGVS